MSSLSLFPHQPTLYFHAQKTCRCGAATTIRKTSKKAIVTEEVGKFNAVEIQTRCVPCQKIYRSAELRSLTPHQGIFGFDVIEDIGKALFVHSRNEREIQNDLARRNIAISMSEIAFLGKRFIVYLALAHRECQEELTCHMNSRGGYILHMDGTCEGGSPHLFSCIDAISDIVLGNRKMPASGVAVVTPVPGR